MNNNQPFFSYNQDSAANAGSMGVQTGANLFTIESAEYKEYNGNQSLNFTLISDAGGKTFVDLRFQDAAGKVWQGNVNHINAIMGLTGLNTISKTVDNNGHAFATELAGKKVGAVLQKRLYTKNDGSDGSNMSLIMPFDFTTGQTMKEKLSNAQAVMVEKIATTLEDKNDRKPQANQAQGGGFDHQQQTAGFDQNNNFEPQF